MILELHYIPVRSGKKKKQGWKSLVSCESEFHIGIRTRVVSKSNLSKGTGVHCCNRCALITKNKSIDMRHKVSVSRMGEKNINYGKHLSLSTRLKLKKANTGQKRSLETRKRMSIAFKGRKMSPDTIEKIRKAKKGRFLGPNNARWNPNLTEEDRRRQNRGDIRLITWRKEVYKKDSYTCQITGDGQGGNLNAHHLYNWSNFPSKRFLVKNGITIREDIHRIFHMIYGWHNTNPRNFKEFVSYIKGALNV